mmetsp:Transcript_2064/g.3106  ORF Transcript_2064/g.3106 Transcript_2064/m.3106 type:complete len:202 (+) Transcript_2064:1081-1686(+)
MEPERPLSNKNRADRYQRKADEPEEAQPTKFTGYQGQNTSNAWNKNETVVLNDQDAMKFSRLKAGDQFDLDDLLSASAIINAEDSTLTNLKNFYSDFSQFVESNRKKVQKQGHRVMRDDILEMQTLLEKNGLGVIYVKDIKPKEGPPRENKYQRNTHYRRHRSGSGRSNASRISKSSSVRRLNEDSLIGRGSRYASPKKGA